MRGMGWDNKGVDARERKDREGTKRRGAQDENTSLYAEWSKANQFQARCPPKIIKTIKWQMKYTTN